MPTLQINYKSTENLIPYANNSRTHSDDQINQVASSIKEFGFTNPVLIDEQGGIIAGHGRVMAAKKLGLAEVPTITLEGLTKAQVKAYVIADNQLALNSGWDVDTLKLEIETLQELEFDIDLLGFDEDFLNGLLDEEPSEGLTDDDAVPELPDDPITVLGDVWQLGSHRLMCGDSTSIDSVEKLMDGHKADMVFTDPPYGVSFVGVKGSMYSAGKKAGKDSAEMIKADDLRGEDLSNLFRDSISCASISAKDGAAMYIFFAINRASDVLKGLEDVGITIRNWLIWDKGNVGYHAMGAQYKPNYESFLYCHKKDKKPFWTGNSKEQTIWRFPVEREGLHPTMKPVTLICNALNNSSKQGDLVVDSFGGSGSTLIACEKTERKARLMELDEKYCDVIIKRWQDFTGKEAVLESSGDKFNDMFINGRAGDGADV